METRCQKTEDNNKDLGMSLLQNNKLQAITSKLKKTTSKEFFQESSPIQNLQEDQYLINAINTSNQKPEGLLLEIDQEVSTPPNCSAKLEKKIQLKLQEDTSNNSLNQDSDPLIQLKQKFGKDKHKNEQKGSHLPQTIIQNMVESQEKVFERKMKKSKQIQKLLVDQFSAIQKSKDKKPISFTQQQLMNLAQTPQSCSSKSFFQSCKTSIDERIKQDQFTSPQHHRPQTNTQPSQIASQNKGLLKKLIQNASSFLSSPNAKLSQTTTQRVSKMMQNTKQLKDLQNYISNSNISSLLKDICSQSMATTGSKTLKNNSTKKSNSIEKEIIQSINVDKSSKSVTRKKSKSRRKKTQIKNCQINNINKSQNQNYLLQYFQE